MKQYEAQILLTNNTALHRVCDKVWNKRHDTDPLAESVVKSGLVPKMSMLSKDQYEDTFRDRLCEMIEEGLIE